MTDEQLLNSLGMATKKLDGLTAPDILRYLYGHPYYLTAIYTALVWEKEKGRPFKWSDVRVFPKDLNRLVIDGILTKDGNRGYMLRDHNATASAFNQYMLERAQAMLNMKSYNSGSSTVPLPPGVPEDIFSDIVGYDDVKKEIMLALNAKANVHVLLLGPPSTAKSLFLEGLRALPGARLTYGDAVSKTGLRHFVMEEHPQYLIIDEIDKMDPKDDTILLELMEHQTVSVMHYNENEMQDISLKVFAAANITRKMRPELLSRFHKILLREYTPEEFMRVAYQHLVMKLRVEPNMAEYIAKGVAVKSRDIRDAIRIANLSRTLEDAQFLVTKLGHEADV